MLAPFRGVSIFGFRIHKEALSNESSNCQIIKSSTRAAAGTSLPRRPLVGLVLYCILGTWLGFVFRVPVSCILAGAAVSLLVCVLCLRFPVSTLLIHLCIVLVAWSAVLIHSRNTYVEAPQSFYGTQGKMDIVGIVAGDYVAGQAEKNGKYTCRFPFRVEKIRCDGEDWRPIRGRITVLWYGPWPARGGRRAKGPAYGERWLVSGHVKRNPGFGLRPGRCYLTVNRYRARFLSAGHGWWLAKRCFEARRRASEYLSLGIEDYPDAVALLRALLLGCREQLPRRVREIFATTGTLHIFAISGLHVGIIALFITFLLTAFRISRVYWVLFLAPLLIAYTLATGARASAVRACIMAIIYFSAPLLGRKTDVFSALALAALAILAAAPAQLFEVGFILSFVIVTGLVVLYPYFERPMRKLWEPDPLRVQQEKKWITKLRGAGRYVCSLVALSCSAWLASAPLMAHFFGRFVPIALVGNLLVIPLAFLIVLTGCLSLVLGSCIALFADIFNHANLALVTVLVRTIEFTAAVPLGSIKVDKPPLWGILLWYVVLTAWIFRLRKANIVR